MIQPRLLIVLSLVAALMGVLATPSFGSEPSSNGPQVDSGVRPLNASVAPCSPLNYTVIRLGYVTSGSWTSYQLENIDRWSSVVSGWWNDTCVLSAFTSAVAAHARSESNFTFGGGNSGISTTDANISAYFGVWWQYNATLWHQVIWTGVVNGGVAGGVSGPQFLSGGLASSGPGPQGPQGPAGTPANSNLLYASLTLAAIALAVGLVGMALAWKVGRSPASARTPKDGPPGSE
jgi:hypothetical protein